MLNYVRRILIQVYRFILKLKDNMFIDFLITLIYYVNIIELKRIIIIIISLKFLNY